MSIPMKNAIIMTRLCKENQDEAADRRRSFA